MDVFVHLLNFFGITNVQAGEAPRDLWGAAPNVRGIYGAPPHTPHAFLKKAWEKQCFTAKYPTHSVRAILCGFFCFI